MIHRLGLACLLWILTLLISPSISVAQGPDIELSGPTRPTVADPGDVATLVFQIRNASEDSIDVEFELDLPDGIVAIASLASITLQPGEQQSLFVSVVLARNIPAGPSEVVLRAVPVDEGIMSQSATGEIEVTTIANLEIIAPQAQEAEPGSELELAFTLINRGNASDRFTLTAMSSQDVFLELESDEIEMLAGEEREFQILVEIPTELAGEQVRVRLSARSLSHDVDAMAVLTIDVRPALPEQVGGSLFLTIPSSLTLNFIVDPPLPLMISQLLSGRVQLPSGNLFGFRFLFQGLTTLESFRIDYESAQFGTSIGDLSLKLTELFSLSGRGATAWVRSSADETAARADLAAVHEGGTGAVVGGRVETPIVGLTPAIGLRVKPSLQEVLGGIDLTSSLGPVGKWTLSTAFSRDETTPVGRAFQISKILTFENLVIDSQVRYGGVNFLGHLRDSFSLSVDQTLETSILAVQAGFGLARNNLSNQEDVATLFNTDASAGLRLLLSETTDFSAEIGFNSSRNPEPVTTDDLRELELAARVTQELGPLRLSAIHERARTQDLILNTDLEQTAWRTITDLRMGQFSTQIRLGLIRDRDLISDLLLSHYVETLISARIRLSIAELGFSVERLPLSTNLGVTISSNLENLSFVSKKTLTVGDSGDLDFGLSFGATARFNLPVPFVRVQGRIEGFIYDDVNGNGRRNANERGVESVTISLNGQLVRTDASGFFRSQPIGEGQVRLVIVNLPAGYVSTINSGGIVFDLDRGEILNVQIPIRSIGFIRGSVYEDANENGVLDSGERGLPNVRVSIMGPSGESIEQTGQNGQYSIEVAPGEYSISIDRSTLPSRFQLTTPASVQVSVQLGEIANVRFGAVEVLEFRFAPTADFSIMPEEIIAGEPVTFNGTLSLDTDGTIVSHEWDFDGDGATDASGEIITTSFIESGEYAVTLTVTDDDGQRDSVTKVIVVADSEDE